jgi:hypothetical protein
MTDLFGWDESRGFWKHLATVGAEPHRLEVKQAVVEWKMQGWEVKTVRRGESAGRIW